MKEKILEKNQVIKMRESVQKEFEEAVAFAKSSPFPHPDEIFKDLYKEAN